MKFISKYWLIFFLVFLGCIPIIWFTGRGDILINGLDTNFPLDPKIWFLRRLFVWNDTINAGTDFSSSVGGLFFHGIQVIPYALGFSLHLTELFSILFWFSAVVFSAYLFAITFLKDRLARLIFVLIYAVNIYLFNTWENIKVSNLSLVICLTLFLAIFNFYMNNKINKRFLFAFSSFAAIFATGSSINPAYFFTVNLAVLFYTVVLLVTSRDSHEVKKIITGGLTFFSAVVLVNMFWILPLVNFLFFAEKITNLQDIGFTDWLNGLSENTSLLNVFRLQGAWDWYAVDVSSGRPLYIPYAANYFVRTPFIIISFLLPVLSVVSLYFSGPKRSSIFFASLLLIGIFLGAGTHEPTGQFFSLMVDKIPFFSFFRSPWYIFTPFLVLAYAGLVSQLVEGYRFKFKKIFWSVPIIVFMLAYLAYNYPLVTGKIFRPNDDSFFVEFPQYVFDTRDWLNRSEETGRVITYPADQLEKFTWGYRGTDSILGLFSKKELITPTFNLADKNLQQFINQFYIDINSNQYDSALSILPFLGVDTIFNKKDIVESIYTKLDEKNEFLVSNSQSTHFGEWSFFNLNQKTPKIYIPSSYYLNKGDSSALSTITQLFSKDPVIFNNAGDQIVKEKNIEQNAQVFTELLNESISKNPISHSHEYSVSTNKLGNYILAIEKKGIKGTDEVSLSIDGETYSGVTSQTDSLFLFSLKLDPGNHKIIVNYPENRDLLQLNNLSSLSNFGDLREDELPVDTNKTLVAFNGDHKKKEIKLQIPEFNPFIDYVLKYDYKYFYGSTPYVNLYQASATSPLKSELEIMGSSFDWEHKEVYFSPMPIISGLEVIFILSADNLNEKSKTFIENIQLYRIYNNKIFLMDQIPTERVTFDKPNISYKKISPVEYSVNVSNVQGEYPLVFLDNYSNDWILTGENVKATHFTANGYGNGWFISGVDSNQNLKIYYKPQIYFNVGFVISILTMLISLIMLIVNKVKIFK